MSNTGLIAGGAQATFTAEVTVPASASAGNVDIYFRAVSPTNGATDTKLDRVTVNTIVDVLIIPNRSAQAAEGGVAVLSHTLTNNSNIAITEGAITLSGYSAFSGVLFLDVNGDGNLDAGDTVIDNIDDIISSTIGSFNPGASVTIFDRVQVPASATAGQQEIGTITVATSLNSGGATDGDASNNSVVDTVTVVSGDVTVTKQQAVDTACNNSPGAFTSGQLSADPGQCIRYRIVAENTGTADAGAVTISDQTPTFTTLETCTAACPVSATGGTGTVTGITAQGATGAVSSSHGTLTPGQQAVLEFTVRIDN